MILRMPILVALFTVGAVAHATALSFKDISGKWCSDAGDYNFRRDMLIAKFHDRTPTRRLKVSDYDYRDDKIVMYWFWKGEKLYTEFPRIQRRSPHDGAAGRRERTAPGVSSLLIAGNELRQGLIRRSSS